MVAAIAAAVVSIGSMVYSEVQKGEAKKKLKKLESSRPQYSTPDEARLAKELAMAQVGDMPGTAVQQERIDMTSANMVQAAMQSGNPLATLGAIQANQNAANLNLGVANAQHRIDSSKVAMGALGDYAKYKDLEFQMNEFAPWKDQYQLNENIYGASSKNSMQALDSLGSIATAYLSK